MMKTVTKKNPMKMKRNSRKMSDPVGEAVREKRHEILSKRDPMMNMINKPG
jgi:hypothetical protein